MGETAAFVAIMIVESDPHLNYLMQHYVRKSGCRPLVAGLDGEIPALARQEQPGAILLGVETPGAMSRATLRALKADRSTRDIPVVTCSWSEHGNGGCADGAAAHLQRPVRYRDFLAALEDVGVRPAAQSTPSLHQAVQGWVKREST